MKQVQNKFLGGYTVSLARDALRDYLVISLDSSKKVIPYQLKTISTNLYPGLIVMEERVINNQSELYYRLNNDYLSLRSYLEQAELKSLEEILNVLDSIVGIILGSKNYLLYASSFLLHEEYIYINPHVQEVSLIYLPVKLGGDVNENFRDLLKRISLSHEDLYQKVHEYCQESNFSLMGFREKIKEMKFPVLKKDEQSREKEKPFQLQVKPCAQVPEEIAVMPTADEEISGLQEIRDELIEQFKTKDISPERKKALGIFVLVQLAIVVGLYIASSSLEAKDPVATYGGIALIVIALDFLLLKKLMGGESSVTENSQLSGDEKPVVTLKKEKL